MRGHVTRLGGQRQTASEKSSSSSGHETTMEGSRESLHGTYLVRQGHVVDARGKRQIFFPAPNSHRIEQGEDGVVIERFFDGVREDSVAPRKIGLRGAGAVLRL